MSKKNLVVGILAGVILAAAVIYFDLTAYVLKPAQASETASLTRFSSRNVSEEASRKLIELMLNSHNNWDTLQGQVVATDYGGTEYYGDGQSQTLTIDFQIEQFNKARVEVINPGRSHTIRVFNDTEVFQVDLMRSVYMRSPASLNSLARDFSFLPKTLKEVHQNSNDGAPVIYRHPMGSAISSPAADLIYPAGLVQRHGEYTLVEKTEILGRSAWIVDWVRQDNLGEVFMKERFWVDSETGIVLKLQRFHGENFDTVLEEIEFKHIAIDEPVDPQVFVFTPSERLQEQSDREYYNLPERFGNRDSK